MSVIITGNADPKEAQAYVDYLENKYNRKLAKLDIRIDGEYADLDYTFSHVPFERIRRITGYLVGTMDHWNDAKAAEEADRVKHSLGSDADQFEKLAYDETITGIYNDNAKRKTERRSADEQLCVPFFCHADCNQSVRQHHTSDGADFFQEHRVPFHEHGGYPENRRLTVRS